MEIFSIRVRQGNINLVIENSAELYKIRCFDAKFEKKDFD